jgi:hypothetical protein
MEDEICRRCRKKASLPFPSAFVFELTPPVLHLCSRIQEEPEALAAFALVQWERLDWPIPDIVMPLPKAEGVARAFASLLDCFFVDAVRHWRGKWDCKHSFLEEDALILLISVKNSVDDIGKSIEAICEAFPKKIFVLSLIPLTISMERQSYDSDSRADFDPGLLGNSSLFGGAHRSRAAGMDRPAPRKIQPALGGGSELDHSIH